ncbi:DNA-methyltransferase [Brevibacillus sp. NPDC003359]|uniref:DNA-methyltransferase n=1 Tax=unclassified Brevibacillus TaxID=2684853 RepID=UPI0036B45676
MSNRLNIREGLHVLDCFEGIKKMGDESVDTVITSIPYYAVRDYGHPQQFGLESDPAEYIEKIVNLFNTEVYRVLSKTGCVFLNIGDVYGGDRSGHRPTNTRNHKGHVSRKMDTKEPWAKPKQLMQIPARIAIAMQQRGWILRNELIWYKPNACPQSVSDRFSNKYEKVYFFVKSPKYIFNLQDIKIPCLTKGATKGHYSIGGANYKKYGQRSYSGKEWVPGLNGKNPGDVFSVPTRAYKGPHPAVFPPSLIEPFVKASKEGGIILDPFVGTGTTWEVALQYNRRFVGFEINPDFADEAVKRTSLVQMKLSI